MRATGQIETNRETGGADALSSAAVVLHATEHWVYSPKAPAQKDEPPFLARKQVLLD